MSTLAPGSPEWLRTITASKIPSILGVSRYKSAYTVWHEMRGTLAPAAPKADLQDDWDYGHAAELAAREFWKIKNPGWRISRGEQQYRRDDLGFPAVATIDSRASRGAHRRVVEFKTARSLEDWGDDGTGIVPTDYAAQVLWQQFITGWHRPANIVLWPQYGKPRIYQVEYRPEIVENILARVSAWVDSLKTGTPPDLDDSKCCYETVRALHPDIDGRDIQLDPALAIDFVTADRDLKALTAHHRGLKTRVLDAMGTAQTAQVFDQDVAKRQPHGKGGTALKPNPKFDLDTIKELTA